MASISSKHKTKYFTKLPLFLYFYTLVLLSTQISAEDTPIYACDTVKNPTLSNYKFCNTSVGIAERVADLVNRLSLEEKIGFLVSTGMGLDRLGIPSYEWWNEALHGVGGNGSWGTRFDDKIPAATVFPQVLLTAASFNVTLFEAIGKAVSTEARAMHNNGLAGLNLFTPNINIYRDPRWGRGQEVPGEDPVLTGAYATALVRGLQEREDGDRERLKVAACCKHYIAYDIDHWNNVDRTTFNAVVTLQDLEDTFKPPFRRCVIDGNVATIMCSYNQINGKPSCSDPNLAKVVRGEWKLNGSIITDWDAIAESYYRQNYTKKPEETAALALLAGVDLNVGGFLKDFTGAAIKARLVDESVVNRALTNNFGLLMRVGFFDGDPRKQFYGGLGPKDVCSTRHQELAREAARQGIVLLKNSENALPLSPTVIKSLAVIGPYANATTQMLGNYYGNACKLTTSLQGLSKIVPATTYSPGCLLSCSDAQINEAKVIVASADATILIMGDDISFEQECDDRVNITLPGQQESFIKVVASASKGPTILVLMTGGGMDVQFAKDDANIRSILWVGFPGEAGGAAIADVIYGGRLPISWYPGSYTEKIPMTNMNMRPDPTTGYPGRTYRFNVGPTVFDFGDGLSYSKFTYNYGETPQHIIIQLSENQNYVSIDAFGYYCPSVELQFKVRNEGKLGGTETVLFFSSPPPLHGAPRKQLLSFEKVFLETGTEKEMTLKLDACKHLSLVDENGKRDFALGRHELQVGTLTYDVTAF